MVVKCVQQNEVGHTKYLKHTYTITFPIWETKQGNNFINNKLEKRSVITKVHKHGFNKEVQPLKV